MAIKTYMTHRANLSVAWEKATETPGHTKNVTLAFIGGLFTTGDKDAQDYIESLSSFKDDTIFIRTDSDLLAEAEAKAVSLRAVADKAVSLAQEAESAVASLKKSSVPAKAA